MNEPLTKVTHNLGFACDGLQEAMRKGNAVQGIVLLDLIGRARGLLQDAQHLLGSIEADASVKKAP